MSTSLDDSTTVYDTDAFSVSRLEAIVLLAAAVAVVSLALPWIVGFGASETGFEYTWLSPGIVVAAVLAGATAVPDVVPRVRYTVVSLIGVAFFSVGVAVRQGVPSLGQEPGIGVELFLLAGLAIALAGAGSLSRLTSMLRATAIVCVSSLVLLVVALVLL